MKMKHLSVFIVVTMVLALLVNGCARATPAPEPTVVEVPAPEPTATPEPEPEPAEKPKLEVWFPEGVMDATTDWLLEQVENFGEEYGVDMTVHHEPVSSYFNKLTVGLETGDVPDVWMTFEAYLSSYIGAGAVADITDVVEETKSRGGGIVEGVIDGITWSDGKIYGMPYFLWADAWYARKDLLDAAGLDVPTTYAEVAAAGAALADATAPICGWGKLLGPYEGDAHFEANCEIWSFGGQVWGEDGRTVMLKSPEVTAAVEFMKEAWDAGAMCEDAVNWDSGGNNQCYQSGTCAIVQNAGSIYRYLKAEDPELLANTVIFPGPAGPTGIKANMTNYEPWVMSSASEEPDLAKEFLLYLYDVERQGEYVRLVGGMVFPYYKDLRADPMWEDPYLGAFLENGKYSHPAWWPGPKTPWSVEVENHHILQNMYTRVLVEGWDIEDSIDQAVKELEDLRDSFEPIAEAPAAEKPKLEVWFPEGVTDVLTAWQVDQIENFGEEYGVDVTVHYEPVSSYFNKITVMLETGDLPDVWMTFEAYLSAYIGAGAVADITDVVEETKSRGGGIVEGVIDGITWSDGKIYGIPHYIWADAWYARKDLLDAAGLDVPTTYAEVAAAGAALADPTAPICGWGALLGPYEGDAHFEANCEIWSFGGQVWGEDGRTVMLKSPEVTALVEFMKEAWDAGAMCEDAVNWDSGGNNQCYQSGTCAIVQNAGSIYRYLKAEDPELLANTVIFPGPAGPTGIKANMTNYEPWVMSSASEEPDVAKEFLLYMYEVDRQGEFTRLVGGQRFPYYKDLRSDPMWDDPYLAAFLENGKYSHPAWWPGPKTPWSVEVENHHILQNMYTRVLVEGWDIEDSIDQAVKELEDLRDSFEPIAEAPAAEEPQALEVWFPEGVTDVLTDWQVEQIENFGEEYGVDVTVHYEPVSSYFNKITVMLETGDLPDVWMTFEAYLSAYIGAGAVADITDVVEETKSRGGGIVEGVIDGITWSDGKIYGIPHFIWADAWYARKDLLDAAGLDVPTTYAEVAAAGAALADATAPICGWGKLLGPYEGDAHFEANCEIWSFGGQVWGEDGRTVMLKSPEVTAVVEFMKEAWDAGAMCEDSVNWDSGGNNQCYQSGTCAIVQNAGSIYRYLKAEDPELLANTVIFPGPAGPTGIKANMTNYEPWVMSSASESPNLAKEFLLYMYEVDRQGEFTRLVGGQRFPYYKDLRSDPMWDDPYLAAFLENGKYSHPAWWPGPKTPWSVEVENHHILQNMYTRVLVEGWEIEDSIDQAVKELEDLRDSFQ